MRQVNCKQQSYKTVIPISNSIMPKDNKRSLLEEKSSMKFTPRKKLKVDNRYLVLSLFDH